MFYVSLPQEIKLLLFHILWPKHAHLMKFTIEIGLDFDVKQTVFFTYTCKFGLVWYVESVLVCINKITCGPLIMPHPDVESMDWKKEFIFLFFQSGSDKWQRNLLLYGRKWFRKNSIKIGHTDIWIHWRVHPSETRWGLIWYQILQL